MTLPELVDLVSTMRAAQVDRNGNNNQATRAAATVAEKMVDKAIARIEAEEELGKTAAAALAGPGLALPMDLPTKAPDIPAQVAAPAESNAAKIGRPAATRAEVTASNGPSPAQQPPPWA